mmetsp:Transcript_27659/g.68062  ORF Transcript_27659/g.68062 Transcript_27659/m.68062 type:complete len:715 (-) Transcript_27659:210-2354(-)
MSRDRSAPKATKGSAPHPGGSGGSGSGGSGRNTFDIQHVWVASRHAFAWGATLSLCTLMVGVCLMTIFAAPPFGINSGTDGAACVGTPTAGRVCICPRATVCATEWREVAFLVLARVSSYFGYPLYVLLFLTKCHNLRGMLYRTHLSEILPLDDVHHLHTLAGTVVSVSVISHSFWHLLRWGVGKDLALLWTAQTGVTGSLMLLLTPLIAFPMMFRRLRRGVRFEVRKALHYLSAVWGVALCFHAPATRVALVMGISVGLYGADWLCGYFFAIHYCPTLKMTRLGEAAVEVVFEHPPGFVNRMGGGGGGPGGYVYICLPWLSKGKEQWHAFSLYVHPKLANHSSVCIAKVGDWTGALHDALSQPTSRPGYIYGPFPSPFSDAVGYHNLMAVASGIGITPTLGAVTQLSQSRKVNVMWMCREAALVEYFVRNCRFDDDAWSLIFYTGKRRLVLDETQFRANRRLLIIAGRPDVEKDILSIMEAITGDTLLPAKLLQKAQVTYESIFNRSPRERFQALLERALATYTISDLYLLGLQFTAASKEAAVNYDDIDTDKDGKISSKEIATYRRRIAEEGVSLDGFRELVLMLGADISHEQLFDAEGCKAIFNQLDTSGDCTLDKGEFEDAMKVLSKPTVDEELGKKDAGDHATETERGKNNELKVNFNDTREVAFGKDEHIDFASWQVLYCGGAAPVVKVLNEMHNVHHLDVKIESFDW